MALTETQKSYVRLWLGYESGPEYYPQLEWKLQSLSASEEAIVSATLEKITGVDDEITALVDDGALGIKAVDEIIFQDVQLDEQVARVGSRLVSRLESVLGVKRRYDVFSAEGAGGCGGPICLG